MYLDCTRVVPRVNYRLDSHYDVLNRWKIVIRVLGVYLVAVVLYPIIAVFGREDKIKKDVAVQVTTRHVDRDSKNDLFWMDDDLFISKTLLLKNMKSEQHGDAIKLPVSGYSLRMMVKPGGQYFLFKKNICMNYIMTFINFIRLVTAVFNKPEGLLLLPGIIKVFMCKSILRAYSIKVFISNNSFGNAAPLLACSMLDIVYLRGTRSNQAGPHPHIATSSDVFFAWGDVTVDTYTSSGARGTTFVKTGFIDGKIVRQNGSCNIDDSFLNKLKGKFVLGFFDNLSSYDHSNTIRDLRDCFLMFCEMMKDIDDLIILYKPKSGDITEIYNTNTLDDLSEYIKNNRFIVLYGEKNYSNRPAEIAQIMDMVVGFPISSAATETAIAGVPSFHIDLTGALAHPWERDINNQFIFHEIAYAKLKLTNYIHNPELLRKLSNNYIKSANHFNDLRATERMQSYVEALCYQDDVTVSERVSYANKVYINKYSKNNDCIITQQK